MKGLEIAFKDLRNTPDAQNGFTSSKLPTVGSLSPRWSHQNGLGDKHPRPPTDGAYAYGGGGGDDHGRTYSGGGAWKGSQ